MSTAPTFSERELRVKRHVAYTYLLNECLGRDERTGLYKCPGRLSLLVMMPMIEEVFAWDFHGVPGFYVDTYRDVRRELAVAVGLDDYPAEPDPGWMLNLPENGYVRPATDDRGRVTHLHVLASPGDLRPKVLTSKGLTFGS